MFGRNEPLQPKLAREFETLIQRVADLVGEAEASALNRRPAEGRWSAAECIDHLNQTVRLYLGPFDEAIAAARADGLTGERADGRTLLGRVVTWTMEPPPLFKMKTFGELRPAEEHDPDELVERFTSLHRSLLRQLEGAGDLDRKRVKIRSLLDSRLRLSLDDWYAFIAAHARRHLWQAERALETGDA